MDNLTKLEFSFKNPFVPLTNVKAFLLIVIIGFVVYGNMLFNGFVWDDLPYILLNPHIMQFNLFQLLGPDPFFSTVFYRPLADIYFSAMYNIFGVNAFFYHLISLIIHIINTSLLYVLFRNFFKEKISFVLSLLFLVHPINVESVVYISATEGGISFLCGLSALLLATRKSLSPKVIFFIFLLLFLSLCAKETGVVFLFVVFIYQMLYKKRFFSFFIIEGAVLLSYLFIRFFIGGVSFSHDSSTLIGNLSLSERLINIPKIIYYYIKTLFFPMQLTIDQQWIVKVINFQDFYLPLAIDSVLLISLTGAGYYLYRSKNKFLKAYIFCLSWFALGLLFIIQIIPLDMTVADRWLYFPFVGFLGILGVLISQIYLYNNISKYIPAILIIILISFLSLRTIIRNIDWNTGITLYSHDTQYENNSNKENNFGSVLALSGYYVEALIHFQKSIQMQPEETNLRNIAVAYSRLGQEDKAVDFYYKSLQAKSFVVSPHKHEIKTYTNMAQYLCLLKRFKEAKQIAQEGIQDYPEAELLWRYLAISNYQLHEQSSAFAAAKKAVMISPSDENNNLYQAILNKNLNDLNNYLIN